MRNRLRQWFHRPAPAMTLERPHVSIVLGTYNRGPFLSRTVENVRGNGIRVPYEIIVVDGGSTDGSLEWLLKQRDVITIVQHNRVTVRGRPVLRRSWGYFMNLGFKAAQGRYVLMISDDCLLVPDAVNRGLDRFASLTAEGRRIAAVAFYYRDWPEEKDYYVQLTLGGKLMVNHGLFLRSAMAAVGWAEEDRYAFYKADSDLCLKLWEAGWEVVDCPGAFVEHYRHANREIRAANTATLERDRAAYLERWTGIYWDPNGPERRGRLTLAYDDPARTAETFLRVRRCG